MAEARMVPRTRLEAKSPYELRVKLSAGLSEPEILAAVASGDVGFLHSFTTGATVAGPGVRVVAWTAGCPWRCQYCHNPDTWTMSNGMPVSVTAMADELRKYRHGLKVMGGGLTVSGGEPLMQDRFVAKLCKAAATMGVHTALDTNGCLGARMSDEELESIDLVLLDLKAWDPAQHRKIAGADNAATVAFAKRLAARKRPIWVKYVLVPGLTDNFDDISNLAEFVASLGNVERVDVMPFHQLGRFKWAALNLQYALGETEPPDIETLD